MRFLLSTLAAAGLLCGAAQAADPGQQLIDIENALAKAFVARDLATIDGSIGNDWTMQGDSGKMMVKADFYTPLKAGKLTYLKMISHDMKPHVFGNMAFVQGVVDQTSNYAGKQTTGTYTWLDVFQMRGGKWVMIASQISKVTK